MGNQTQNVYQLYKANYTRRYLNLMLTSHYAFGRKVEAERAGTAGEVRISRFET